MRSRSIQRKPKSSEPAREPSRDAAHQASTGRLGPHYSAGPAMSLGCGVQAKVTIGQPGDRYEREADNVAERVTRGEPSGPVSRLPAGGLAAAQRAEDDSVQEASVQEASVQCEEQEPVQESADEPVQEQGVQREGDDSVQESSSAQRSEEESEQESADEPVQEQVVQREADDSVQESFSAQRSEQESVQESANEPVQEQEVQREGDDSVQESLSAQRSEQESVQESAEEPVQEQGVQREGDDSVQESSSAQRSEEESEQESADEPVQDAVQQERAANAPSAEPPPKPSMASIAARGIRERGPGDALQPSTRRSLERGMNVDLRDVRVHSDARSQEVAGALRARAFTHQNHIWLGRGESQDDLRLMAHETTHVLQQDRAVRRAPIEEPTADAEPARVPTARGEQAADSAERRTEAAPVAVAAGPVSESVSTDAAAPEPVSPASEAPAVVEKVADAAAGESKEAAAASGKQTAEDEGAQAPARLGPEEDPRFQGVMKRLDASATTEKAHEPAAKKVSDAKAAVEPPTNDRSSQAQAAQVDTMSQQEAPKPETNSFLAMLRAKLAEIAPSNMEETEKFKKEGKAGKLKDSLTGEVTAKKDASAAGIKSAAEAEPDASSVEAKDVVPLPAEPTDKPHENLGTGDVLPTPKSESEVSAKENTDKAEQLMADNDLDEGQLEKANEPQFAEALDSKKQLEEHASRVPEQYRETEQAHLADAKAGAEADEKSAQSEMRGVRAKAKEGVAKGQDEAKKKEEEERKRVADEIQSLYEKTKKKVEGKLDALDGEVDRMFDAGEKAARDKFESHVDRRMSDYKYHRYIKRRGGALLWAKDKLFDMPDEVNKFYEEGRDLYLKDMDVVLVKIAETVETRLKAAKDEIQKGKDEIRKYVEELPKNLQKAGKDAESGLESKFADLEQGVDSKKEQLAQKLAQRYKESRDKLDERIKELKAANQGLLSGFIGKIKEIIRILKEFKERVMALMKSGADTVRKIVKDPIGFLKQLLKAVKTGFGQFKDNILMHLKKGLVGWLFGTMAKAGVEMPAEFNAKGVFGLVTQVLGLTKERIRKKLVRLIGAKNVARVEAAWSVVSTLMTEGPAGLWSRVKEFMSGLKETIISGIRDFIITQIVKQAVMWLISLFNPAAALLKAIKLIYDVIMFFVENIERILQLVEAVIQSVAKIVAGNVGAAANWIEAAMGKTVPIIISFLARILGLGGISGKIKKIIKKIQKRVDKAVDKVLLKIAKGLKKGFKKGKAVVKDGIIAIRDLVFPKRKFKAGDESHTLYFKDQGKSGAAVPMVASKATELQDLLNKLKSRHGSEPDWKGANKRLANLKKFSASRTKAMKSAKSGGKTKKQVRELWSKHTKKVKREMNATARHLANLLAMKADFGTEKKPLSLKWPKPFAANYPPIYVGPRTREHIPQSWLRPPVNFAGIFGKLKPAKRGMSQKQKWAARGYAVEEFKPTERKSLPEVGITIGLSGKHRVYQGMKYKMTKSGKTGGGGKLNNALRRFGYRPGREKMDADHVIERQLGGDDHLRNLWPLASSVNRAAGGTIASATFTVRKKKIPMSVIKARVRKGTPVWFRLD